jgi:hypothetical protein
LETTIHHVRGSHDEKGTLPPKPSRSHLRSHSFSQTVIVGAIQTIVNQRLALGSFGGNPYFRVRFSDLISDQRE